MQFVGDATEGVGPANTLKIEGCPTQTPLLGACAERSRRWGASSLGWLPGPPGLWQPQLLHQALKSGFRVQYVEIRFR
jgi:hypothetical protein